MNHLYKALNALSNLKQYDLSQTMKKGMPIHPAHPPFHITLNNRHGDVVRACGHSSSNEMMVLSTHSGTHIDALSHVSNNGKLYGDLNAEENQKGVSLHIELGPEEINPMFKKAVLLDIAAYKKVLKLEPAYEITIEDIKATMEKQKIPGINEGDILLFRTGWGSSWDQSGDYLGLNSQGAPGVGAAAARYLAEFKPFAVGSDTSAFEVMNHDNITLEVHMILIADNGIFIMENLNLEELSKDKKYEMLYIALPIKIEGATGSLVRPIALTD